MFDESVDTLLRRQDQRYFVDLPPILIEARNHSEFVQIINLAKMGFLAKSRCFYRTNEFVNVIFPDFGPIECRIVWFERGMLGGKFVHPVETEDLTRPQQANCRIAFE